MASATAPVKMEKPSFAKVAAAGLKLSSVPQSPPQQENIQKRPATSSPQDGANVVSPSKTFGQSAFTPKQKKLVALAPSGTEEAVAADTTRPEVYVQSFDVFCPLEHHLPRLDGTSMPVASDEAATQISSSNDSVKQASLDDKSITSGTTFALDEKESLRPDDSASVMSPEDEEGPPGRQNGTSQTPAASEDEMQAFRNQLREISDMDTGRPHIHPGAFGQTGNPAQGVLYIPPQGPGVGNVPVTSRMDINQSIELPPDPKLLEALESPKDRIMVLKLEQDIVDFVKDAKESSLKLPQTNAFYRMLAHKLADYYMLGHIVDESTMAVRIFKTPNCRLPPSLTGIATPSTAASTPPPLGSHMKILRRGGGKAVPTIANGSNVTSKTTSENGESGNEDDKKSKPPASREEREARYEAARKRIMGSERPASSPDQSVGMQHSRSSSANGKKSTKKKPRADSDDDFQARSAYSAYYSTAMSSSESTAAGYSLPSAMHSQPVHFAPTAFDAQSMSNSFQQYNAHVSQPWTNLALYAQTGIPTWTQPQTPGYDLPRDFQQAMSFQPSHSSAQNAVAQKAYDAQYNQPMGGSQQAWSPQSPYMPSYPSQMVPAYPQGYSDKNSSSMHTYTDAQCYAYGQLPSQAFPGRPPSQLEHPLPGSYKGKYFNPQSQSFVPGHVNDTHPMPFRPNAQQAPPSTYNNGLSPRPTPPEHAVGLQQAYHRSPQPMVAATPIHGQPMTHPLPHPVFRQQPSPNLPLPPKPEATPPRGSNGSSNGPAIVSSDPNGQGHSSISKWGTPASLPAKPPPTHNEAFDSGSFAQSQRQPSRFARPPHGMPMFGSMPAASGMNR